MSSRDLNDLHPDVKAAALKHIELCAAEGIELLIYCTLRSGKEQDELYAQGRTAPGTIVTWARAGESFHNPDANGKARAYDCVPVRHGKAVWTYKTHVDSALWAAVGLCGEAAGLSWAGRWRGKKRERPHFQSRG